MSSNTIAALCNLVLITEKNARSSYMNAVLNGAFRIFPAKMLIFTIVPDSELAAMKITRTQVPMSELANSVLCEKVEYFIPSSQRQLIYFCLCRDLQSDRECYLVFGDAPEKLLEVKSIAKMANKVLFDSELSPNLQRFAKDALSLRSELKLDVSDLNWSRILSWRMLFYNYFNDKTALEQFSSILKVEIAYNKLPSHIFCHARAQSIYFSFWLANCLGWEFSAMEENSLTFVKEGKTLLFTLVPEENNAVNTGKILRVVLFFEQDRMIRMSRNVENVKELLVDAADLTKCSLQEKIDFSREGTSYALIPDLAHIHASKSFFAILEQLAKLPKDLKCSE